MQTIEVPGGEVQSLLFIFDTDDEVLSGLEAEARRLGEGSYVFTALGAFRRVVLGWFDWERKDYRRIPIDEQVEVVNLTGNITRKGGALKVHAHVVVCKSDGTAHGGHLLEGCVRPTLEMSVRKLPIVVERTMDPDAKIALIDAEATRERTRRVA